MNLFSPILRLFGVGGLSSNDKGNQVPASSSISTDSGISVSNERAMRVSAVWACVQYITNSVASLPLTFYDKTNEGREEVDRNHYLNRLFNIQPNALMKARDFRKAMTFQMCLWQNAYAEITWAGNRPVALMPLRPGRMVPFITNDGELQYHYSTSGGVHVYEKKSILHLKGFGSDGISGLERVGFANQTLGLSVSADTYAAKQFANGGGPGGGGFLTFDEFLTDEQREQARERYSGMSETAYQKGKLWVLEGGVKFTPDTLNPDTLQMLETRRMQLGEIARFFGVPEVLIGAAVNSSSSWPASFEQQLLSFLTFTLQDYIDEWESGISYSVVSQKDKGSLIVDHDVSGFIKMDAKTRASVQSSQVQNGIKTRAEVRKANNDPHIEGTDELTVQVNLTPADQLGDKDATENTQSA